MSPDKAIQIKCKGADFIPLKDVNEFQGELKELTKENYDKLKYTILTEGFCDPLNMWQDPENQKWYLLDGHQRTRVLKMLHSEGYFIPELPMNVILAKDKEEAKTLVLTFSSNYGKITNDSLANFMTDANLSIDLLDTRLVLPEIDDNYFEPEINDSTTGDADEVPELKEDNIHGVKAGDVWCLGDHRLMCGDSTNPEDVSKLMNGQKAEMVFTDPPYNQPDGGGANDKIGKALHKQTSSIAHLINFEPEVFLQLLPSVFNKNMNAYVFTSKDLLPDYLQWAKNIGYAFNVLVWKKPNAIPIGGSHRPDVEYLLTFRKSGTFNSGMEDVNYSKVIECKRDASDLHPTMKPIEIVENQVKIGSSQNSIVVDFFGGSGSTLIACEKTNRKCYMMELDPHYCSIIIERWQRLTGKQASKANVV